MRTLLNNETQITALTYLTNKVSQGQSTYPQITKLARKTGNMRTLLNNETQITALTYLTNKVSQGQSTYPQITKLARKT